MASLVMFGISAWQLNIARTELHRVTEFLDQKEGLLADIQLAGNEAVEQYRLNTLQIGSLKKRLHDLESLTLRTPLDSYAINQASNSTETATQESKETQKRQKQNVSPRYTYFEVPQDGVEVWQNEKGYIQASNDDPSLTGTSLMVQAEDEAGNVRIMRIILPPPEE